MKQNTPSVSKSPRSWAPNLAVLLTATRLRSSIPRAAKMLVPEIADFDRLQKFKHESWRPQQTTYNRRPGVRNLADTAGGTDVWIVDLNRKGTVQQPAQEPRSYILDTGEGTVCGNRAHLIP